MYSGVLPVDQNGERCMISKPEGLDHQGKPRTKFVNSEGDDRNWGRIARARNFELRMGREGCQDSGQIALYARRIEAVEQTLDFPSMRHDALHARKFRQF